MYMSDLRYMRTAPPTPDAPTLLGGVLDTSDSTPTLQFFNNGGSYFMSDGNNSGSGETCTFILQISKDPLFT